LVCGGKARCRRCTQASGGRKTLAKRHPPWRTRRNFVTARVLAVANQKGGVGKTTTAVNVGTYLALGVRVLLIDLDPQANATSSLGIDVAGVELSTYEALIGEAPLRQAIIPTGRAQFDLAPASRALAGAQVELVEMK